jgi:AcrR family transcriptional regulator
MQTAETRQRIVEAALSLHREVGPLRTSVSAVAKRAGVERPTVYRHFPDDTSLLAACRGLHLATQPPPDPRSWATIEDPEDRLQVALAGLYGYYEETEHLTANLLRDAAASTTVAAAIAAMTEGLAVAVSLLAVGWTPGPPSQLSRAALEHAVAFETWRSLCRRSGLDRDTAIHLVVGMVGSVAR